MLPAVNLKDYPNPSGAVPTAFQAFGVGLAPSRPNAKVEQPSFSVPGHRCQVGRSFHHSPDFLP